MSCDYRKRFARLAQACFLPGSQMGRDAKAAGLDPSDIVKALTGVVLAVLMCQAPECVKDRDCSSGQRCVGGACKVTKG